MPCSSITEPPLCPTPLPPAAREQEKKKAAEDKKRRREENEAKNTTYQVLADPNSIKTMSKKQLKMIRKTEVSSRGITRLANPWGSGQEEGQRRQGHDGPATRRHAPAAKRQKRG